MAGRRRLAVAAFVVALLLNPLRWVLFGPGGSPDPRTGLEQTMAGVMIALSLVLFALGLWLVARGDG